MANEQLTFVKASGARFDFVSKDWGLDDANFSNGATYADLDNDGDLEIIINNVDQEAQIYKNNSTNNFIKVKLKGDDKNLLGIDSRVIVETESTSQMQELTMTRGFQSSVSSYLNFGIGNDDKIKKITVIWNNGNQQILDNVEINSTIELDINNSVSKEVIANNDPPRFVNPCTRPIDTNTNFLTTLFLKRIDNFFLNIGTDKSYISII